MKAIKCEMCNSSDIVKDGDYYICQSCGTKYTAETAKKLMIEGVINIDHSQEIDNLYILARRAKATNEHSKAKKYYDLILEKDPQSWEAVFYETYYGIRGGKSSQICDLSNTLRRCLKIVFDLIEKSDHTDKKAATDEICKKIITLADGYETAARSTYEQSPKSNNVITNFSNRIIATSDFLFLFSDLMNASDNKDMYSTQINMLCEKGVSILYENMNFVTDRSPFTKRINKYGSNTDFKYRTTEDNKSSRANENINNIPDDSSNRISKSRIIIGISIAIVVLILFIIFFM